jgi:hypothetical protein
MIFFAPGSGGNAPTGAAQRIQAMQDAGFFVVACVQPAANAWAGFTPATYAGWVRDYIAAGCSPDVWELGNEPHPSNAATATGPFWARAQAGADEIHSTQPGVPVVLGAPEHTQRTAFYNNANSWGSGVGGNTPIPEWCEGFAGHYYGTSPTTVLSEAQSVRTQINAFGAAWAALPCYITEFGWSVYTPSGFNNMVVPPGTAGATTAGTQSGNLYVAFNNWVSNRTSLKLRTACWYIGHDLAWINTQNGWCGLRSSDEIESRSSPPWSAGSPSATNTARASYTRLTSGAFDAVYDPPALPAPVATTSAMNLANVTQTVAGLQGTVDPNGSATTRYFRYGTSPTLSTYTQTPGVAVGSGDTPVNVGYTATGLTAGTTYYFMARAVSSAGVHNGVIRSFTTDAPPLAPTVTTGSATNVTPTGAVLNGLIDPNGLDVTDYHFVVGTQTTNYLLPGSSVLPSASIYPGSTEVGGGFNTDPGTLSGTATLTSVSATLTDLEPNTVYFFFLVGTNSAGTSEGIELSFRTGALQGEGPLTTVARPKLPSLAISVEIATVDGRTFRWDDRSKNPRERPYELTFSTAAGDGFADASCILYRPIGLDYPDLRLLARGRFIGSDAQVVYDGRVSGLPRTVDSSGEAIQVQFQGLMAASGKDRPFMEVYADRSGDRWQEASLNYRVEMANSNTLLDTDYTASVDTGSVSFRGITQKVIPVSSQGVLMWQAPSGVKAKRFQYKGQQHNISPNCEAALLWANDTDSTNMGSWDSYALTMDSTIRSTTLTTGRSFLGLRLRAGGDHTPSATEGAKRIFRQLCVYGDHDVALQDNGSEPDGVYASDVLRDIVDRFCPYLDASEIDDTSAILEHLVFDSPTMPFDAFTTLNGFHQWLLGAYEDGKVIFRPADLTRTDWIVNTDADGIDLTLQGEAIDGGVANGMPVAYTDVSERQVVLWPDQYEELRDDDPDHPANQEGITRWPFVLELSNKATKQMALRLGEVALEELNRAKRPGTVTVQGGYVLDLKENPRPAHEVRYGQTLAFGNLPNISRPHLITATSWNQDGSLSITLEQPPTRVDAVMARLELAHTTSGIA